LVLGVLLRAAIVFLGLPLMTDRSAVAADVEDPGEESEAMVLAPEPMEHEVLVCDGGWRFPLYETRRELGPARLARLFEIQRDIVLAERAFGFCRQHASASDETTLLDGACQGLFSTSAGIARVSEALFAPAVRKTECLGHGPRESGHCEQTREQLTTLRRYQRVGGERAALVASHEVCASPDRNTNRELRERCTGLETSIREEAGGSADNAGRFGLSAPLPESVAKSVEAVRQVTDGHFLGLVPEDYLGVQEQVCERQAAVLNTDAWGRRWGRIRHSLCAELAVATHNAETCRDADLYVDERGQMHVNRRLDQRKHRKNATLCIDISDFDGDHPLMITLGLAPTSSVPERLWPGETVVVGHWIDERVKAQDVLTIGVFGKARGVSLKEVLRINGADPTGRAKGPGHAEACRIARSWVPVVDHEVPIGDRERQAVIPVDFGRGRNGSTSKVEEGDHLVVWVRDIEPAGAVKVEYANGQSVGYEPPPLLGQTQEEGPVAPRPNQYIRGVGASVGQPLLPRRARYPGSRVLRLGAPAGNSEYGIRICSQTRGGQRQVPSEEVGCSTENIIVNERVYVHGYSRMGLQVHVGYSFFRAPSLTARRTAAARAAGEDLYEIVEETDGRTNQDIAMLLAVYPFGRDPYSFSHRPWTPSYWRHASLLCGFSVKKTSFWEDVYLGGSLPLANGISTTLLAHFSRRETPSQTNQGQFLSIPGGGNSPNLGDYVPTKRTLSVGVGVGLSFDLNLFQKAFSSVWARVSSPPSQFYSNGSRP